MPKELALDLASLALYDIVMFVDDSGSMAFEEGGERIDDLKLIAGKVGPRAQQHMQGDFPSKGRLLIGSAASVLHWLMHD
jgi:hypothetical protein